MKRPDIYQVSIVAGIVVVLLGLQLRVVESFELTPEATNFLARLDSPPAESPQGTIRQIVVDTAAPRQKVRPWPWLGWACLSVGFVLTTFGVMQKWRR